jgi:hypothetical protein
MAPRTAGGMTHSGHTHRENYGFIGANRPAPASVFSRSLGLHLGNLGLVAHGEHTPRTAHGGCIPEYTYPEGPIPSLVTSHGQVSCLRNQRIMARDKLARGMALTGHILLGNHVVNHTKGSALMSALGHGLDLRLENLGPTDFGGRTLGAAHGGCIPEPTYAGGLGPLSHHWPRPRFPPRKPDVRGSWRAHPRNGPRWPQHFRESQDCSNQRVNACHRLLPDPNSPREETRFDSQTTHWTTLSPAKRSEPGHARATKPPTTVLRCYS